jgi:hypothetical protein
MKLLHKRLLRCAAIACLGLAGSAVATFAQAPVAPGGPAATNGPVTPPPPLKCEPNEKAFKDGNGLVDNFVTTGPVDPPTHPVGIPGLSATNIYDQTVGNYHFGDTFSLSPPGQITKIRVTTRLKAIPDVPGNDAISFSTSTGFTSGHISVALPSWNAGQNRLFWFTLLPGSLSAASTPPSVFGPLPPVPASFFDPTSNQFHVYVQDDTSVDFIQIEGCYKPAPKYDLTASKKHDGNVYILNVHNNGSQIMPTGHVDVVEVVPAGLTITSFPSNPWNCTGLLPVVGPDSFTCSYQIPAGGIASGANLPQIVLKSEGKAECPNCMRVKLYLKEVGDKPVDEGDMKNNVSCTN